jgi:hypothetical protein
MTEAAHLRMKEAIKMEKETAGYVQLKPETKIELRKLSNHDETYDDIVKRLIKLAKEYV